ncbi:uncharacterized protein DDB_G0271670-like [Mizuhopecten yessoensis]|uniref:Uncharacterized protein n=1 Tax=Mizuhopecten yessoensis TaxID=6573 RepID=A0A210PTH1_MIZYE|nr:uncharacterized protein DDB_G0271670-like [Mizuhopecten yessoensis]OWF39755.1 hypothetical protein KP79_PYT16536 [Mizuhopecten yessoensis]
MEQPLDLSQREHSDSPAANKMETDDVICPYVNCACPLRHVPPIDIRLSQHFGHFGHLGNVMAPIARAPFGYLPGFYTDAMRMEPSSLYLNKRNPIHDASQNSGVVHPKRRKVEECRHTVTKSAPCDESSSSKSSVSPKTRFFRPGFPMENGETSSSSSLSVSPTSSLSSSTSSLSSSHSPSNISFEKKVQPDEDSFRTPKRVSPSAIIEPYDVSMTEESSAVNDNNVAQRERSKTISYMERLPKKRVAGRLLSQDTSNSSSFNINQSQTTAAVSPDTRNSPSSSPGCDVITGNDRNQSNAGQNMDVPSPSVSPVDKETRPKVKPSYDVSSLKADMIREIDEAEKRERCPSRQKTTYIGYGKSRPSESKVQHSETNLRDEVAENPGGVRMTALDYLISKTLLQREDRPYKARNHHIHQIIRGEKPGKLCLMDIVELQVEIGLA